MVSITRRQTSMRRQQIEVALAAARRNVLEASRESFVNALLESSKIHPSIFAKNPKLRRACIDRMNDVIFIDQKYFYDVKLAMTRLRNTIENSFYHEDFQSGPNDVNDFHNLWAGEHIDAIYE